MKHAFLIYAHHLFEQLQLLINLLDDERNDIYVHIDKKVNIPKIYSKYSKLHILKKRIDVRWGSFSQIKAELLLFETAYNNSENYSYYHLISGVDLPIKSNNYIHSFFKKNEGKEFIGICQIDESTFIDRVTKIHFFRKWNRTNNVYLNKIRFSLELIINQFHKTPKKYIEYKKGPNWVSITNEFCSFLIKNKRNIYNNYKYSLCPDEIYKQTLVWNSSFKQALYTEEDENGSCKRLIDWERGNPYVYGEENDVDFEIIKSSKAIFARKFDISKYPQIIELVKEIL